MSIEVYSQDKENNQPPTRGQVVNGHSSKTTRVSRIPVPTAKLKRRTPLASMQIKIPSQSAGGHTPHCPSQVKEVPDFQRLHRKWQERLEKKKQANRAHTQIQAFALTPAGKFSAKKRCDKPQSPENKTPSPVCGERGENPVCGENLDGSFEVNTSSLKAILSEQPPPSQPPLDCRATIAGPLTESRLPGLRMPDTHSQSFRFSVYSKHRSGRMAHSQKPKEKSRMETFRELCDHLAQSTASRVRTVARVETFQELCDHLAQSATNRARTVAKVEPQPAESRLQDIKLNLIPQFSQAATPSAPVRGWNSEVSTISRSSSTAFISACSSETDNATNDSINHSTTTPAKQLPITRPVGIVTPMKTNASSMVEQRTVSLTVGARFLLLQEEEVLPSRSQFYEVEGELCDILAGKGRPGGASREECRNPVAEQLGMEDSYYHFIPIRS